ncbi:MAG: hypothetical protein NVS3B21_17200 [Acidimicrobiales bacterium]
MAPRWLRSRPDPPSWAEVREALQDAAMRYPDATFEIAGPDAVPAVSWTDGPAGETFVDAVGDLPGWTLRAGDPGGAVSVPGPVLYVRRDLSDAALAVAVIRFYGAQGRHWSSSEGTTGREAWRAVTQIDDPARSGYPIPDTMAALLLDAPAPEGIAFPSGDTASRADAMAAKLAGVGYEKLWAVAFAAVP